MISDYVKAKLIDEVPGILSATSHLEAGKQIIRVDGTIVIVGPFASDNEVEAGIRSALGIPAEHVTALPAVNITEPKPMANLTGGYKPGSLKALLQGVKDRTDAVMASAVAEVTDLHKALDHVENVTRDAKQTKDDIRAELGQFTNMPDDDAAK